MAVLLYFLARPGAGPAGLGCRPGAHEPAVFKIAPGLHPNPALVAYGSAVGVPCFQRGQVNMLIVSVCLIYWQYSF
ncbi:MAG: hypothetical protein Q7T78_19480 [Rhodoferax sp.]|nr:hypothetical protein [Rhodoferax sp.]